MKRFQYLLIVISILLFTSCSVYESTKYENNYSMSSEIKEALNQDDDNIFRFEPAACSYSFIGQDEKATIMWDSSRVAIKRTYNFEDIDTFKYKRVYKDFPFRQSAREAIINRASSHKITIINEVHHSSKHRLFTHSLLEGMYDNGYRHLGLEAIIVDEDLEFIEDEQDVNKNSGFYVQDPEFSEMIKHAIDLGYKVFEYEANDTIYGADRERIQAENILKYSYKFPNDKILLHSGLWHLVESESNKYTDYPLMGSQIKILGGIDPFTVDQTRYDARSHPSFEKDLYKLISPKKPIVIQNSDGEFFNTNGVDVNIFHPSSERLNNNSSIHVSEKIEIEFPAVVYGFRYSDNLDVAIPFDIKEVVDYEFELKKIKEDKIKLVIEDRNGKSILLKQRAFKME